MKTAAVKLREIKSSCESILSQNVYGLFEMDQRFPRTYPVRRVSCFYAVPQIAWLLSFHRQHYCRLL